MKLARDYFLQSVSCIFLFAFSSLYVQIPGLYGDRGILPARAVIKSVPNTLEEFLRQPSLVRFAEKLGLSVEQGMDACCIAGMLTSSIAFLFRDYRTSLLYVIMFFLYLALFELGQTFLSFQWDILLLEIGFLSVFVADIGFIGPRLILPYFPRSSIALLLIRWLLFRLMFAAGIVKLTSRCPTWWGLTALNYHYESQCIPTPLAWYAHQLPEWFNKFSTASALLVEIPVTFLFFFPISAVVRLALCAQVFLQVLIILTGNYNFFNFLTISLCLSLGDGGKIYHKFLSLLCPNILLSLWIKCFVNGLGIAFGGGAIAWIGVSYFSMRFDNFLPPILHSKIAFTESELSFFIEKAVPFSMFLSGSMLFMAIINSVVKAFWFDGRSCFASLIYRVCATVFYSFLALGLFSVSCIPFCHGLHRPLPKLMSDIGAIDLYYEFTKHWNMPITSSYGLFRRMTGVGGRPEVVIEAALSERGPWLEYEFMYKPGNVSRIPPVVAPHQPRLDWQMWFAALTSIEHNPWFLSLCERLLSAEPSVLNLLAVAPFGNKPPRFIRAKLFHYWYDVSGKSWWRREFKSYFLSAVTRKNLVPSVARMRVPVKPEENIGMLANFIGFMRQVIGQPEGFMFLSSIFASLIGVRFLLNKYRS